MASLSPLRGRRVLIVEDELMVAMLVEDALTDEQCSIVGPCGTLADALLAARSEAVDVALLDVNLAGEMVFPVAEALEARGVPFLLLTGYGSEVLPPAHANWPVCGKPFKLDDLLSRLRRLLTVPAARP
jgi:DNA-binding response OmpR family regulator